MLTGRGITIRRDAAVDLLLIPRTLHRSLQAPPRADATSRERTGDSDNNAADFRLISPGTPQTSGAGCNVQPVPTNPTVTGSASPDTVAAGSNALLTATVTAGTNPSSSGLNVTVATSAIGIAGNTQLLDNGNNGDATAGDNVFSRSVSVAAGTAAGAKSLPVTVTDAQGPTGTGAIALTVVMQPLSAARATRSSRAPTRWAHGSAARSGSTKSSFPKARDSTPRSHGCLRAHPLHERRAHHRRALHVHEP